MMRRGKKYGNRKVTRGGVTYDSKKENAYAWQLDMMKRGGAIADYQLKPRLQLKVNGQTICFHEPDFLVTLPDGTQQFHEVKGGKATQTPLWRLKMKLTEALYPDIPYIVIDT